jgi:hypothetical protein
MFFVFYAPDGNVCARAGNTSPKLQNVNKRDYIFTAGYVFLGYKILYPWSGLPDGLFSNQKSQIWVNFVGPLNGKCWYIL